MAHMKRGGNFFPFLKKTRNPLLYLKSAPAPIPRSLSGHILHPFAIMVYMRVTCAADVERATYHDLLDNMDDFPEVKAKFIQNCSTSVFKDLYLEYFRKQDQQNRVSFDHRLVATEIHTNMSNNSRWHSSCQTYRAPSSGTFVEMTTVIL